LCRIQRRYLHKLEFQQDLRASTAPEGIVICPYDKARHHAAIRTLYAEAFEDTPWPSDWDEFLQFDPRGVFVAEATATAEAVGYVISFQRDDIGYVSVLAVVPAHRRRGIALALILAATDYLRSLDVASIQVDAFTDSLPAVSLYESVGFRIIKTYEDEESQD
jgi:ribosomal protein S18 acetylase RimI-like enzyme